MGVQVKTMSKYGVVIGALLLLLAVVACARDPHLIDPGRAVLTGGGSEEAESISAQEMAAAPASSEQVMAPPSPQQSSVDPQPSPWRTPQPLQAATPAALATPAPVVQSEDAVLRGEKGESGDSGARGPIGDSGPPLVDPATSQAEPKSQESLERPSSAATPAMGSSAKHPAGAQGDSGGSAPPPLPEGFNVIGGTSPVNDADYDLTFFQHTGVNPFIDTEDDRLSTFAVDVDTASYTVARRFIQDGNLPDPDSIRVEEFVNFFDQGYPKPVEDAFAIHLEGSPSRFGNDNHWLLRVGLQGKSVLAEERKDASLVFAIDVSGSMGREDRLGLVKQSLRLLVNELRPTDEVGIVVYGSRGRVLLEPTSGEERSRIMEAINQLSPSGSTYVEEGLVLAYGMAGNLVKPGRITQVILLSDGVGNVGRTGADSILKQVRRYVDRGVTLTTVGFGMGNYNDILMERLANDGDGSYYYVDNLGEARRIFVDELSSTIQVIARDAKVQVEFNPEVVTRYRLLGYENRRVADQDFRNDAVDAGEIGANHSVTALYELKLHDQGRGRLGTVYMRYEDAGTGKIIELNRDLRSDQLYTRFSDASARFQLAAVVAEYAEVLRQSYWAQNGSLADVAKEARRVRSLFRQSADAAEFAELVIRTEHIQARLEER